MSSSSIRGHATKAKVSTSGWCSILLTTLLVLIFFCGGVFIGSKVSLSSETHYSVGKLNSGLPNTYNIFNRWSSHGETPIENGAKKTNLRAMSLSNESKQPLSSQESESTESPDTTIKLNSVEGSEELTTEPAQRKVDMSYSMEATTKSYMVVSGKSLDNADLLVSAYIYLHDAPAHDNDMRTIFSNKKPGCEATPSQYGVSLFVNSWQQGDGRLHVEYGGATSGCHKLDSQPIVLHSLQWYHVAVYAGPDFTILYIDGSPVTSVHHQDGGPEAHGVQDSGSFIVGQYDVGQYAFYGNISSVAVMHGLAPSTEGDVTAVVNNLRNFKEESLFALYTLEDFVFAETGATSKDTAGSNPGKYVVPLHSDLTGIGIVLIDGTEGRGPITDAMKAESDKNGYVRRQKIKDGMRHAWAGYRAHAWGRDELKPISAHGQDNWGGMGVTLVDSLDTLWIMGMKDEFNEAKEWVKTSLSFSRAGSVSVFETTIRELGGLLAAYDLSGENVFLEKATQLGNLLLPAFRTRTGIPMGMVNFHTGEGSGGWAGNSAILSELGTLQVEFRYLAHHTKIVDFETKAMKPLQMMHQIDAPDGLYPIKISIDSGKFADSQITFGALGDSFYEYLLKTWLQGGKKEKWLRDMYDRAMDGVVEKLLLTSGKTGLAFLSDWNGRNNNRKMDHLVCFMPGTLALGAYTDPHGINSKRAVRDLSLAKALMFTCHEMYHRMLILNSEFYYKATGIAPEYVEFPDSGDMVVGSTAPFYILRPETAESMFILNQLTGDPIYRDWAWEIWTAIEKHCKTKFGYGAIPDVNRPGSGIDDRMESFFLAETMKYLYLAQDPDKLIDLMKYVFNTEAHPTKILDDSHVPIKP